MTFLTATQDFAFTPQRKGARKVTVRTGQRFWITNSKLNQKDTGLIMIDRYGKGCISHGYPFTPEQIGQLFSEAA